MTYILCLGSGSAAQWEIFTTQFLQKKEQMDEKTAAWNAYKHIKAICLKQMSLPKRTPFEGYGLPDDTAKDGFDIFWSQFHPWYCYEAYAADLAETEKVPIICTEGDKKRLDILQKQIETEPNTTAVHAYLDVDNYLNATLFKDAINIENIITQNGQPLHLIGAHILTISAMHHKTEYDGQEIWVSTPYRQITKLFDNRTTAYFMEEADLLKWEGHRNRETLLKVAEDEKVKAELKQYPEKEGIHDIELFKICAQHLLHTYDADQRTFKVDILPKNYKEIPGINLPDRCQLVVNIGIEQQ